MTPINNRTVMYLRSSKDRSDVSIDAQRRELTELAKNRGLLVTSEFVDAVESGKDENRPGFQSLIRELKDKARPWSTILMLDTSRLARNQYIAHFFRHQCRKRGVDVLFAKTPEMDGIAGIILPAVLHAMDEVHSFMSREKGLAGMAENVRQGFRAGGRAPFGYDLEKFNTGSVRDGEPVTKSKLKPNEDAPSIQVYLDAKASGSSRMSAKTKSSLTIADTTLIGIEWNALTYAGHTVWNVHNELTDEGYTSGEKRRPRSEWVVQKNTHAALITDEQAETILAALMAKKSTRKTPSAYLLTGLLFDPEGQAWHGNGGGTHYRLGKGKKIRCKDIDDAILKKIGNDLMSPAFITRITKTVKAANKPSEPAKNEQALRAQLLAITKNIDKLAGMLAETTTPAALLRQIEKYEADREQIVGELDGLERIAAQAKVIDMLTERDVRNAIECNVATMETLDRDALKQFLGSLIDAIVIHPAEMTCSINYRLTLSRGDKMASPRGFDLIPPVLLKTLLRLAA